MKLTPKPREGHYLGSRIVNVDFPNGTWLEGEEFAYPAGGFTRRAYADHGDVRRVVKCSIPDTYFTIPARLTVKGKTVRGYLTTSETGITFNAHKEQS